MTNLELRFSMRKHHIRQWELAEQLDVPESTFSRWLRHELPEEKKILVQNAMNTLILKKGRNE